MRLCGGYIIVFVVLASSFAHNVLFSLAKEDGGNESGTTGSAVDVTVLKSDRPKRRRWLNYTLGKKPRGKFKNGNATRELKQKGTKLGAKRCHSFIKAQQDPFLERSVLPLDHYKYIKQDGKLAYQMAFLSHVAYWEFHKYGPLPAICQGFQLAKDISKPRFGDRLNQLMQYMWVETVHTLVQSNIALSESRGCPCTNCTSVLNTTQRPTGKSSGPGTQQFGKRYNLHFSFYNWYESGVAGVKFHDTDVLLSTSHDGKELVIAFAGTQSAADAVTNIQTFEPANHSSFFMGAQNRQIQGSLHRGFLNAYTRVDRGSVLRVSNASIPDPLLSDIVSAYGHCKSGLKQKIAKKEKKKKSVALQESSADVFMSEGTNVDENLTGDIRQTSNLATATQKVPKPRNNGGCRLKGIKLVDLLRKAVIDALRSGRTVHVTGHSLGGGLATLLVGDIIINHPEVSVKKLHLWTFGAPQVADSLFLESAIQIAPRLKRFLKKRGNGRFHRFVTLSDDCKVDAVAEVAKNALATHKTNFHGRYARRLGGVHGHVLHFAEPHYLLTPDQFGLVSDDVQRTTATHSTLAAHSLSNYLQGLSRESRDHPLVATMPLKLPECFDSNWTPKRNES